MSLALFGKKKNDGRDVEINTLKCKQAYITFDRPVTSLSPSEMNGRKIVEAELFGDANTPIVITNNRRTPQRDDDLTVTIANGPLYYIEKNQLIWTNDDVHSRSDCGRPAHPAQGRHCRQGDGDGVGDRRRRRRSRASCLSQAQKREHFRRQAHRAQAGRDHAPVCLRGDALPRRRQDAHAAAAPRAKETAPSRTPPASRPPKPRTLSSARRAASSTTCSRITTWPASMCRRTRISPTAAGRHGRAHQRTSWTTISWCASTWIAPQTARRRGSRARPAPRRSAEQGLEIETAHATGPEVTLTSDAEKLDAHGNDFFYDAAKKLTILKGVPYMEANKDESIIQAPELQIQDIPLPHRRRAACAENLSASPGHRSGPHPLTKKVGEQDGSHDPCVLERQADLHARRRTGFAGPDRLGALRG